MKSITDNELLIIAENWEREMPNNINIKTAFAAGYRLAERIAGKNSIPKMKRIKCKCMCHTNKNMKHCFPCCDNGYKLVPESFYDEFE